MPVLRRICYERELMASVEKKQSPNDTLLMMKFQQYDVVKLKGLHVPVAELRDAFNLRGPVLGDVATIIEIYSKPPGYELECCDSNGITQWMMAFRPEDVELELLT